MAKPSDMHAENLPALDRALVQEGKPGHYVFVPGTPVQRDTVITASRKGA
jgi:hypothetical protein